MSAPQKEAWHCETPRCQNNAVVGGRWCTRCLKVQRERGMGRERSPGAAGATNVQLPLLGDAPAPAPAPEGSTRLPRARNTDPATSHVAAGKAARGLTAKQRHVLSVFREIRGGLTLEELVAEYGYLREQQLARGFGPQLPDLTASSIRTRASELVALGQLRDSGEKRKSARGNPCAVLELAGS